MIDAVELLDVRTTADGKHLRIRLRDSGGNPVLITLPACWLGLLVAARRDVPDVSGAVPISGWALSRPNDGQDVVLTLRSTEGTEQSFAMKSWQIDGLTTLLRHSVATEAPSRLLH